MRKIGLQGQVKHRKRRTTQSDHRFPRYPNQVEGRVVVRPEQVWVSDITYVRLRYGFVYLAVIMDVFTRCNWGWHLGQELDHSLTLTALERALARYPAPEIHHSDQVVQYAATAYPERLIEAGQNGYAERLIRTIKEEE